MRAVIRHKFFVAILVFGGLLAIIGLVNITKKIAPFASIFDNHKTKKAAEARGPVYSFYKDDDRDGLANAWEVVFGSDPEKYDTDGDGYSDKEEVDNGYDPLIKGEKVGRLEERKTENLSIDYYLWARRNNIQDPTPEDLDKIQTFASKNKLLSISKVSAGNINLSSDNSDQSLRNYFSKLDQISFPQAAFDYQSLAENYSEGMQPQLDDLINRVDLALADLKRLKPSERAIDVQRNYITILQTFRNFLQDLKKTRKDPVRIEVNILKAPELIKLAAEAEKIREDIGY